MASSKIDKPLDMAGIEEAKRRLLEKSVPPGDCPHVLVFELRNTMCGGEQRVARAAKEALQEVANNPKGVLTYATSIARGILQNAAKDPVLASL